MIPREALGSDISDSDLDYHGSFHEKLHSHNVEHPPEGAQQHSNLHDELIKNAVTHHNNNHQHANINKSEKKKKNAIVFPVPNGEYLLSAIVNVLAIRSTFHQSLGLCGSSTSKIDVFTFRPNCVHALDGIDDNYDIVLAASESLPLTQKQADLIETQFNVVVKTHEPFSSSFQGGGRYTYSYDKFYVFTYSEYDKILQIDSDVLVVKNILDAFEYTAPACVLDPVADIFTSTHSPGASTAFFMINPNATVVDKLQDVIARHPVAGKNFGDMSVIIEALQWKWTIFPRYYLMINYVWEFRGMNDFERRASLTKYVRIIHFSSPKPWFAGLKTRLFGLTRSYYRLWSEYAELVENEYPEVFGICNVHASLFDRIFG